MRVYTDGHPQVAQHICKHSGLLRARCAFHFKSEGTTSSSHLPPSVQVFHGMRTYHEASIGGYGG